MKTLVIVGVIVLATVALMIAKWIDSTISLALLASMATVLALGLAWYRFVPKPLKWFLTTYLGMILIEAAAWYLGFGVLPDAAWTKLSFILTHILLVPVIVFERKRVRGKLPWQQTPSRR